MLEEIKLDLPNFPDEVIEGWLLPHFNRFKIWPPSPESEWRYVLGRGRDLKYLKAIIWQKSVVELSPSLFSKQGLEAVVGLFATHILRQTTAYSMMSDSFVRFENCVSYLEANGVFPKPIILHHTDLGFEVWDGNHRLTAFFYLYGFFNVEDPKVPCLKVHKNQSVWVGRR